MKSNKNRVLVLIESLDINDSSATKGRMAFLQNFYKLGYDVTALYFAQSDVKIPGIKTKRIKERISIYYFLLRLQRYLYRYLGISIGNTIDKYFGFSFGFFSDRVSAIRALKKLDPNLFDMVWTFGKGNSFKMHAALLKVPTFHSKWYSFIHDPYPQQLYPRPFNFVPRGYRKKRMFFREVTINSHRLVFPSKMLKEWMQSYYVAIENKSLIIPHQISTDIESSNNYPPYFDIQKFSLLHAGNLLDLRDPKPIVEAFDLFLKRNPKVKDECSLIFLGKQSYFTAYLKSKSQSIPQIFVSEGYVDFQEVYSLQMAASVNIILEAKSEISPFLPGKFPHCVASNSPILLVGPYYSECKRLLGPDYLYSYDFDEIEKIANGIEELYTNWKKDVKYHFEKDTLKYYLSMEYMNNIITQDQTS